MKSFKELTEVAKMQRQHYQLVADVIASLDVTTVIKKAIAVKFADAFEGTNKLFKRERFIKATKAKSEGIPTSGGKYDKHMFPFGQDGKKKK